LWGGSASEASRGGDQPPALLARRARSVEFTAADLVVTLADGRKIAAPLDLYPRLKRASAAQRANYEIMAMGIHWPDLDEDLGIVGMLKGQRGR